MAIEFKTSLPREGGARSVGLCAHCRFSNVSRSDRGGEFWRCGRPEGEPDFPRYPPLPVNDCHGFEDSL